MSDSWKYKKAKGLNKNAVAKISCNKCKDTLLNETFFRHSVNRSQSKNRRIGTCEINKISLFSFNGKIYILGNEIDALILSYQNWL